MAMQNMQALSGSYDTRWFIWTIVFLVVTGISLVSYIALSDTGSADNSSVTTVNHVAHKTLKK